MGLRQRMSCSMTVEPQLRVRTDEFIADPDDLGTSDQ
jgi:hypothetical protein